MLILLHQRRFALIKEPDVRDPVLSISPDLCRGQQTSSALASKRFILRSRRASPPGLVQTVLVAVNKIVVFVDNKSTRERVWRCCLFGRSPGVLLCYYNRRRRRPATTRVPELRERPGLFRDIDHVSREFGRPRIGRDREAILRESGLETLLRRFFYFRRW